MRLLIITQTLDRNDPILGFFHRWVEEFAHQCEWVHVVALNVGTYSLPENVTVHALGKSEGKGRLTQLARLWRISFKERAHYDAVFAHMNPEYVLYAGWLWRLLGKKVGLWYTHGSVSWRLRLAARMAHVLLTASPESFRIESPKRHIVGHGIDTQALTLRTRDPDDEVFRILSISRITPSKRLEEMIEAVDALSSESPVMLHIIGGPATPEDAEYVERVTMLARASARVSWEGGVPHEEIGVWLGTADLFINLSTTNSIDKAVLEAMTRGVPVITSNVAFRDLLGAIELGLVVTDGTDSICDAVNKVLDRTPNERAELGRSLRAAVEERYALPQTIERIRETLRT